ncbi:MAG: hypothetical protein B7W99_00660 [Rhodospirillales bacterium 20-58-10]|nr:MAG: hypothetical protein B7W99_00660 [Rhodospirillales bacterium 20-58-10]
MNGNHHRAAPWTQFWVLVGFLGVCLAVAGTAGALTVGPALLWYATLTHPWLSPPNWVFGPVWSVMYGAMAVAAWIIWREPGMPRKRRNAMTLWGVQLALNASWSPVYFGLHMLGAGLVVILALWVAVAATSWRFYRLDPRAGWLMAPYVAWVGFATYLNAGFWWLNR